MDDRAAGLACEAVTRLVRQQLQDVELQVRAARPEQFPNRGISAAGGNCVSAASSSGNQALGPTSRAGSVSRAMGSLIKKRRKRMRKKKHKKMLRRTRHQRQRGK